MNQEAEVQCLKGENKQLRDQVSDLTFELKELRRLNCTPLDLPKEWGLARMQKIVLGILMAREGIVTYDLIYNHLYHDAEDPPLGSIVHVYVTHLRKVLRPLGGEIINYPREGFKLSDATKEMLKPYFKGEGHG